MSNFGISATETNENILYFVLCFLLLFYSNNVFVASKGSRENAQKVLIVITDGESQRKDVLAGAVKAADSKNIVRFAIGVSFVIYIIT